MIIKVCHMYCRKERLCLEAQEVFIGKVSRAVVCVVCVCVCVVVCVCVCVCVWWCVCG